MRRTFPAFRCSRSGRGGFTFLEAILALGVLAVALTILLATHRSLLMQLAAAAGRVQTRADWRLLATGGALGIPPELVREMGAEGALPYTWREGAALPAPLRGRWIAWVDERTGRELREPFHIPVGL